MVTPAVYLLCDWEASNARDIQAMLTSPVISRSAFDKLRKLDTCTVSNAIERLQVRLRNEGSLSSSELHSIFPNMPPMLGYAATGRMHAAKQPALGRAYQENMHWWRYVASIPEPRVMVVEDADKTPGSGALMGAVHAAIGLAMHCAGYVTNGSVRDLPDVEELGFPMFAGSISVTHMYAHISEFGVPVEIGGARISPGDLIHGDCHGVHIIPIQVASQIPEMALQIQHEERQIMELCRSPQFSLDSLEEKFRNMPGGGAEVVLDDGNGPWRR